MSQQPSLSFSSVTSMREAELQSPDLLQVVLGDPAGLCSHGGGEGLVPAGQQAPHLSKLRVTQTEPLARSPTCVQAKPAPPCLP